VITWTQYVRAQGVFACAVSQKTAGRHKIQFVSGGQSEAELDDLTVPQLEQLAQAINDYLNSPAAVGGVAAQNQGQAAPASQPQGGQNQGQGGQGQPQSGQQPRN
jgi:hypothetical protein